MTFAVVSGWQVRNFFYLILSLCLQEKPLTPYLRRSLDVQAEVGACERCFIQGDALSPTGLAECVRVRARACVRSSRSAPETLWMCFWIRRTWEYERSWPGHHLHESSLQSKCQTFIVCYTDECNVLASSLSYIAFCCFWFWLNCTNLCLTPWTKHCNKTPTCNCAQGNVKTYRRALSYCFQNHGQFQSGSTRDVHL